MSFPRLQISLTLVVTLTACGEGAPSSSAAAELSDATPAEFAPGELAPNPSPALPAVPTEAPRADSPPPIELEPEVEPEPAPDPEAIARERAAAARAAFEREYPWQGVVYHFLGQVHARPDASSPVVGYMRRGAQFRAQPSLRGPGCARGWSRVAGSGFVCRGGGFQLGTTPQSFSPSPVQPAPDSALPYPYAWVARDDVPQYWRLPSPAEEAEVADWLERVRAREESENESTAEPEGSAEEGAAQAGEGAAQAGEGAPVDTAEVSETPEPNLEAPPALTDTPSDHAEQADPPTAAETSDAAAVTSAGDPTIPAPEAEATPSSESEAPAEGHVPAEEAELEAPSVLRMRMRRGFYVSIDRLEESGGRRFYRTIRGGYIRAETVVEANPPAMRGVVLGERWALPLGFVYRGGVRSLRRRPAQDRLVLAAPVPRLTPLPLQSEVIARSNRRYRVSDRGTIVREDALRIAQRVDRPAEVPAGARWVHVNLQQQVLVAYEDETPVFATMVSTGREGYETPVGLFRIQSKHVSTTMDDPDAGDESYSIEDVPWTMYFQDSYALHAAFWHDRFGRVRSHGCVNLAPADARWVFEWSLPSLPPGWHGMSATRQAPGTWVFITAD